MICFSGRDSFDFQFANESIIFLESCTGVLLLADEQGTFNGITEEVYSVVYTGSCPDASAVESHKTLPPRESTTGNAFKASN